MLSDYQSRNGWPWPVALSDTAVDSDEDEEVSSTRIDSDDLEFPDQSSNATDTDRDSESKDGNNAGTNSTKIIKRLKVRSNANPLTPSSSKTHYDNWLLTLAIDLGERLLPAFHTVTGIPYGTVNLRSGVPPGETEVASTAGAGSLTIEFEVLSRLTGDDKFGLIAFNASKSLFERRSGVGLLGKHIHTRTGNWMETSSGIGSNADSFYEYLLKSYLLFNKHEYLEMFIETYHPIKRSVQYDDWFGEVDMMSGKSRRNRVESLQAFWPGMEAMVGMTQSSAQLLNAFYGVWNSLDFFPEEFDQLVWLSGNGVHGNTNYPLRPELIESTYHHYMSTKDRSWLKAGLNFLESIETYSYTECGYASVSDSKDKTLSDDMPSYFLSETCKYLYLLFDETNFLHDRAYIFSTEAHPFDVLQLPALPITSSGSSNSHGSSSSSVTDEFDATDTRSSDMSVEELSVDNSELDPSALSSSEDPSDMDHEQLYESSNYSLLRELIDVANSKLDSVTYAKQPITLSLQCPATVYWDADVLYDATYLTIKLKNAILNAAVASSSSTTAALVPSMTTASASTNPPKTPVPVDLKAIAQVPKPTATSSATTIANAVKGGILSALSGNPTTTFISPFASAAAASIPVESHFYSDDARNTIISRLTTMSKIIEWDASPYADLNSNVYFEAASLFGDEIFNYGVSSDENINDGPTDKNDQQSQSYVSLHLEQQRQLVAWLLEIQHALFFTYLTEHSSEAELSARTQSTQKCYPRDKYVAQEEATTQAAEAAQQTNPKLELNAGVLGMFSVISVNDGFRIESHKYNDVVEVMNGM